MAIYQPSPFEVAPLLAGAPAGVANTHHFRIGNGATKGTYGLPNPGGTALDIGGRSTVTWEIFVYWQSLPTSGFVFDGFQARWISSGDQLQYAFYLQRINASSYELRTVYRDASNNQTILAWDLGVPATGVWRHLAVSVDLANATALQCKGYDDGVDIGNGTIIVDGGASGTFRARAAANDFQVAGMNSILVGRIDGFVDEIRHWLDVRTPTEIAANRLVGMDGSEPGMGEVWNMNNTLVGSGPGANVLTLLAGSAGVFFTASPPPPFS